MPIYEYRTCSERHCDFCRSGFEILQKMSDPKLSACPQCQASVKRQVSAASVARSGPSLDPAHIEKHGFTQYRKAGKGVYEKTAGKGPNIISDD